MSSHKRQKSGNRTQKTGGMRQRRAFCSLVLVLTCLSIFTSCRMDMQDQPKYKAYSKGSIRKPVQGTVPRGYLREDKHLYTGKKEQSGASSVLVAPPLIQLSPGQPAVAGAPATSTFPDMVDTFPFPITDKILERGEERFNAFCSMCHGPVGYGDGMIVKRGFRTPPSYHTDRLREAPVGHFFDVITNGWGAMSPHASMIPVTDRWAIIAYIRALQLSQNSQGTTPTTNPATQARTGTAERNVTRGQR